MNKKSSNESKPKIKISMNDKFLKVETTSYFSVSGLNIRKIEDPNSEEGPVILLNGKELTPYIEFDYAINKSEDGVMEDVPVQDVKLEEKASSWAMNFITRRELYKEDPSMEIIDEIDVRNGRAEYEKEPPPDDV